jgi:hypothetical protein
LNSRWSPLDRLRPGQAAAILGLPPRALRSLREQGLIAGELTDGGQWTYDRAEIEQLAERRSAAGPNGSAPPELGVRPPDTKTLDLRDRIRRYASILTTTDRRFPADHFMARLCEQCDQDPYYWRWNTASSDDCFRLVMRRVEARLTRWSDLAELKQLVEQTVRDFVWSRVEERGGFAVHLEIDSSIPPKMPEYEQ